MIFALFRTRCIGMETYARDTWAMASRRGGFRKEAKVGFATTSGMTLTESGARVPIRL